MGPTDCFMDPWKDENQRKELMFETTREVMDPYGFETNDYCMLQVKSVKKGNFLMFS